MENRRNFISKSLAFATAAVLPLSAKSTPETNPGNTRNSLPSLKGKKILFVYGGWPGHQPEKFAEFMTPWMKEEGADVLLQNNLNAYTDKALMATIDLVIQIYTMSEITPEQEKGLIEAVEKNGTGMAGWHGGFADAFRSAIDYHYMTGGQFVKHPGTTEETKWGFVNFDVKITNHEDEVTRGLKDFSLFSEQYYMHVDPNVKVLATTRFNGASDYWIDGCTMPAAWKKMHGKGRIFFNSIGHTPSHLTDHPDAFEMLKRGIRWASASKYEPAEKWISPVYK